MAPHCVYMKFEMDELMATSQMKNCDLRIPLSAGYALSAMHMRIDGLSYTGSVQEKVQAREKFVHQTSHGAVAAEAECKYDVVTVHLGNVTKFQLSVEIIGIPRIEESVTSQTTLSMTLHVPIMNQKHMCGATSVNSPFKGRLQLAETMYLDDMTLDLDISSIDAHTLSSPTHNLTLCSNDATHTWEVRLTDKVESSQTTGAILKILFKAPESMYHFESRISEEMPFGDKGVLFYTGRLNGEVWKKLQPCPKRLEYIFIVDCSNSMVDCIEKAAECMAVVLRNLQAGCKFNILRFGTEAKFEFLKSLDYSEHSVKVATEKISLMRGDMGCTNVLQTLAHLGALDVPEGYERTVVLLTDGMVANYTECGIMAESMTAVTQWFGLGIGAGASTALLRALTKSSGGFYSVVSKLDSRREITNSLLSIIIAASASSARVQVSVSTSAHPDKAPPTIVSAPTIVRDGCPFLVIAAADDWGTLGAELTITSESTKVRAKLKLNMPDNQPKLGSTDILHKLVAKHLLDDFSAFQLRKSKPSCTMTAAELLMGSTADWAFINLSKRYGVVFEKTAMLLETDVVHICKPIHAVHAWDRQMQTPFVFTNNIGVLSTKSPGMYSGPSTLVARGCTNPRVQCDGWEEVEADGCGRRKPKDGVEEMGGGSSTEDVAYHLVKSLSLEGYWTPEDLPKCLHTPMPMHTILPVRNVNVWATICSLTFLLKNTFIDMSLLVVIKKTLNWLTAQLGERVTLESLAKYST